MADKNPFTESIIFIQYKLQLVFIITCQGSYFVIDFWTHHFLSDGYEEAKKLQSLFSHFLLPCSYMRTDTHTYSILAQISKVPSG